jgi:hypothetical protein
METNQNNLNILIADDDADEFFLLKEGLKESQIECDLRHLPDGDALMDYLQRQSKFIASQKNPDQESLMRFDHAV